MSNTKVEVGSPTISNMARNMKDMQVIQDESRATAVESASVDSDNDIDLDFTSKHTPQQTKWQQMKGYMHIATQGDLAGFQCAWLFVWLVFLPLKIFDIHEMGNISWPAIFCIPIANCFFTGWFDWILRRYRSANCVESLRKKRFVVLWCIKIIGVIYFTALWIWGEDGFIDRFSDRDDYNEVTGGVMNYCTLSMICIFVAIVFAVWMSEMMITIVLINSEQNLSVTRTPYKIRVVLLFLRPIVWVYNRTMVMFLCFYALYGLIYTVFIAGAYADYYCYSANVNEAYGVGVQMLVIPFTVPDYLFRWTGLYKPWKDVENDDLLEAYVIAFLCNSFYVDALNSIFQFSKRFIVEGYHKYKGTNIHHRSHSSHGEDMIPAEGAAGHAMTDTNGATATQNKKTNYKE